MENGPAMPAFAEAFAYRDVAHPEATLDALIGRNVPLEQALNRRVSAPGASRPSA
jgi:hypothetical protein